MDRDVALQILSTATAIKTAVQTIATNTAPSQTVGLHLSRNDNPAESPEITDEPKPETK